MEYFEDLVKPPNMQNPQDYIVDDAPYLLILDDPFRHDQVGHGFSSMNINKSHSGPYPGVVRHLPMLWMLFVLTVFITFNNRS